MGQRTTIQASVLELSTYAIADLPPAADHPDGIVKVSNGAGGSPILAFSDGTNWKRSDTGATVS